MRQVLSHEEMLSGIARFVMDATEAMQSGDLSEDELPSSSDIARHLGIQLDTVKKKMKLLKSHDLIQPISFSPKRYRFNLYAFHQLDEASELYALLRDSDSPYYLSV